MPYSLFHPGVNDPPAAFTLFRSFRTVLAATLFTLFDAQAVQRTTHYVIPDVRKVANLTTANQNDTVFLEVMIDTRDIGGDFFTVAQSHTGDLSQRGVGLLGRYRLNKQAHAS